MPLQGILSTARSLGFYTRLQEVTSNNLANANTDAFKADRLTAHLLPDTDRAVAVERTDFSQGAFRETGRPLDLGLDGPGFLVVDTARGQRLFRGGSLQLDTSGRLTDAHGNPVLGEGGPLVLQGSEVKVQGDGSVEVDGALVGRLRLVSVADPASLRKEGGGQYSTDGAVAPAPEDSVRIRQGAVEDANLDPLLSMIDLITIQRAYAASIDAIHTLDGVLGVVSNEVGKV
jgi:flagellar basal-body rod protein FlgF